MTQPDLFPIRSRKLLSLSEVQAGLLKCGLWNDPPSRPYLIARIEEGELEGRKERRKWYVFEDSLRRWVESKQQPQIP